MKKTILAISLFLACASFSGCFVGDLLDPKKKDYISAIELYEDGEYKKASERFAELGEYRDSEEIKNRSLYHYAGQRFADGDFDGAIAAYASIEGYRNSSKKKTEAENEKDYAAAVYMFDSGQHESAKEMFSALGGYRDSADYISWITYLQANELMDSDPDGAVDMLTSLRGYNEELTELINDILYGKANLYMDARLYEKALPIFETMEYKESAALYEICAKHIKYKNALAMYEAGETEAAYSEFLELGDFIDSIPYVFYIEAGKAADEQNFGEAAEKYLRISSGLFLDSKDLYEKYIYLYYDQQFQFGNRDLSKLPLLPLTDSENDAKWRQKRLADIKNAINAAEGLEDYYAGGGNPANPAEVTGFGIYVNERQNAYYVKDLTDKIIADLPAFFLADSPEKVRYVVNFPGSSEYFGTYDDGTFGYETKIAVTIKDAATGETIFSKDYAAYPESEVYYPASQKRDVYAVYNFFEAGGDGKSAYDEIFSELRNLFK